MKKLFKDPLFVFSVSFYLLLTLPRFMWRGMFLDGASFASMAVNLAMGKGSFWHLYYTKTIPYFADHPSLAMWLQSWALKVFGFSTTVDTLWSVGLGLIIIFLIALLYKEITREEKAWWPVTLFIIMPLVPWSLTNNMLENTMTVFVLLSSIFIFKATKAKKVSGTILFSTLSGAALWCALFSKGFQGLFPFAIPLFAFVTLKDIKPSKAFAATVVTITTFLCFIGVTYLWGRDEFRTFANDYINGQIIASLSGQREAVANKFYLFYRLLGEIVVPFTVAGIIALIYKAIKRTPITAGKTKPALFFLLIALSASIPLCLVAKQKGWYLFTSLPFYAMAVAAFFTPPTINPRNKKAILVVSAAMALISITCFTVFRDTLVSRDKELYQDIVLQNVFIPESDTVSVCPDRAAQDWALVAYFQRNYRVSLMPSGNEKCDEFIKGCTLINNNPKKFALYKCGQYSSIVALY
ncbi:MAG: glycosyltransferase family 39 protein [Pseudomonadota bacterium]